MTGRCKFCGKPVYFSGIVGMVECEYCYQTQYKQELKPFSPDDSDWTEPLIQNAMGGMAKSQADQWLILLGDTEAIRRLEETKAEIQRHWELIIQEAQAAMERDVPEEQLQSLIARFSLFPKNSAAEEWKNKLEQRRWELFCREAQAALEGPATEARLRILIDRISQFSPGSATKELKEKLEQRRWQIFFTAAQAALDGNSTEEELNSLIKQVHLFPSNITTSDLRDKLQRKLEKTRMNAQLAVVRKMAEDAVYRNTLEDCLQQLRGLKEADGYDELVEWLHRRINELKQRETWRLEQERKAAKRQKIRNIVIFAACLALLVFGWHQYVHVMQPRRLNQARELAAAEEYSQAEEIYQSLSQSGLFKNQEVQEAAENELQQLRRDWAADMASRGQYQEAITLYQKIKDREGMDSARAAWAEALTAQGELEEALSIWKQVSTSPEAEEKIATLSTKLTLQYLAEGDYEQALKRYTNADQEILAEQGVTEVSLRVLLAEQALAKEDLSKANKLISPIKDDPAAAEIIQALHRAEVRSKIEPSILLWKTIPEDSRESWLERIRTAAENYSNIDDQLLIWQMANEEGIDLTQLFPEGVNVGRLTPPKQNTAQEDSMDLSHPLVFIRREIDYLVIQNPISIYGMEGLHREQNPSAFTVRMMPESWLALPEEKRPRTLEECTVIVMANLTYDYLGRATGTETQWSAGRKSTSLRSFQSFAAQEQLLMWTPGAENACQLAVERVSPRYGPESSSSDDRVHIDWTSRESIPFNSTEVGLSGAFDPLWAEDQLAQLYQSWR